MSSRRRPTGRLDRQSGAAGIATYRVVCGGVPTSTPTSTPSSFRWKGHVMKAIALRLRRAVRFLLAAAILMPAFYGVLRLSGDSLAKPTSKEKVEANQGNGYGQPVSVTGTGYEPSAAVSIRVTRPDGGQDTALTSVDRKGNLSFSYKPRSLAGAYVLETLGEGDFGLAAAGFNNGATIQALKGNYFEGELAELAGSGWQPNEAVTLIVHESNPSICPDRAFVATADSKGTLSSKAFVMESHDDSVTFTVTATGQSSALTTQATFTSSVAFVGNIGTATRSTSGNNSMTITVSAVGVAGGDSILVAFASSTVAGAVGCSDSKSNTYHVDADRINGASGRVTICSAHGVTALASGDTITVTYPSFSGSSSVTANEFQGLSSGGTTLDVTATGTGNTAFPTSGPSPTTSQADELLYGAIFFSGTNFATFTPGAGYTRTNPDLAGRRLASEYMAVSATGSYQANGTLTTANQWAAALATYKVGPPPTPTPTSTSTNTPTNTPTITPTPTNT
ncbi:MAG TPA: hypothetical protein VKH43_01645, partial [Thermoanaerobaculia bacterium]|nr:hypothetical protein [Thermoanaerobaculia bacterium]